MKQSLYAKLSSFAESRYALGGAFTWGLLEAMVFFVVPDFFVGFIALFNWKRALFACVAAVVASIIGGAIVYVFAYSNGAGTLLFLSHVPGISPGMIERAGFQVQSQGLPALVSAPLEGVPYKVFAAQIGERKLNFLEFIFWSVPSRFERIVPATLLAAAAGFVFRKGIRKRPLLFCLGYLAVWVVFYLAYFKVI